MIKFESRWQKNLRMSCNVFLTEIPLQRSNASKYLKKGKIDRHGCKRAAAAAAGRGKLGGGLSAAAVANAAAAAAPPLCLLPMVISSKQHVGGGGGSSSWLCCVAGVKLSSVRIPSYYYAGCMDRGKEGARRMHAGM